MFFPLLHNPQLEGDHNFRWRFAGLGLAGLTLIAYWQQWIRSPFQWDLAIALTFVFGYRTFLKSFQDAIALRISADQAVTVAALAALYVGQYLAAAEVVYIMLVGETLEEYAARRFHSDIKRLLSCLPHHASVIRDGAEHKVHLEEIRIGETVLVYPGQRIPVDGEIVEGISLVDESSITGESVPRERAASDAVFAGTLNQTGRLVLHAVQVGESTVLSRIVDLVRHARENKAPIQRTADRYARWFLPLVLLIAGACFLITRDWMRAIAILIVACPCPMVLATPAAVLASISALARRGIIVKGGIHLERLAQVNCVAFDKTGTLTLGRPELVEIVPFDDYRGNDLLAFAASIESHSEHLLAQAIRDAANRQHVVPCHADAVQRYPGLGMEGTLQAGHVLVGSARFLQQKGVAFSDAQREALGRYAGEGSIAILIGVQNRLAGALILRDAVRPESARAIHQLQHLGIHKTVLLTGDHAQAAQRVARAVGISEVYADLLPEEKLARLQELKQRNYTVAMVGDGVNDSPSLAAADVGIAMGDTGTDIAAEAAGVVLMGSGGLDRLAELIRASRRTLKTIQDNILWFGLIVNLTAVLAAFAGYLSAIAAAVVHQCSSFLVLMNSLKLLQKRSVNLLPHHVSHRLAEARKRLDASIRRPVRFAAVSQWARRHRKEWLRAAAVGLPALYLLSGVAVIRSDEIGIVQRFGRVSEHPLLPGLRYVLPWPVERLHRIRPARVNSLEIGFRIASDPAARMEPAAYEWNIQHRQGGYIRRPDEALMLTGDEYLVEVNAIVQYSIRDPKRYLFALDNLQGALRAVCEGSLRYVVGFMSLDQVLALDRDEVERLAAQMTEQEASRLNLGVQVLSFNLQDVHPALEVVGSFREVAGALEEKNRMINQAQAYANERLPLARGESQKRQIEAEAYRMRRVNRGTGEAQRFNLQYDAYRTAPQTTRTRLYLEAVEAALGDKSKYILDQRSGRRKMMLIRDSIFNFADLEKAVKK
jgi:Cu+-exporting ATPase